MDNRLKRFYERKGISTQSTNKEVKKMINPIKQPIPQYNQTSSQIIENMPDEEEEKDMYNKIITEKPTINKLRTMIKKYVDEYDDN